jgi:hypothetical protein
MNNMINLYTALLEHLRNHQRHTEGAYLRSLNKENNYSICFLLKRLRCKCNVFCAYSVVYLYTLVFQDNSPQMASSCNHVATSI